MLISVPNKALLLDVHHASKVLAALPHARHFAHGDKRFLVVPHKIDETMVLRNLGLAAPSPILYRYAWPHRPGEPPFAHQKTTAAFLTLNPRAFVLSDFRTGKTLSAYWAADFLMREGLVRRCLVVAPLSTLVDTHKRALFQNLHERTVAVLHGTGKVRAALARADFDFYLINHDGVETAYDALAEREDIDLIIIDECAKLRNGGTARWRWLKGLVRPDMRVWGMTAAPTPNEPPEAYAQVRLINPSKLVGYPSYRSFQTATMRKVSVFKWRPQEGATEKVHAIMQPSIRFTRDECFELPLLTTETVTVDLTPSQKKAYAEMMKSLTTEVNSGQVLALNEGVKLMKLLQIVSGVVYDATGTHQRLDCKPRLDAVKEIIEEAANKVIVLVPFKGNVRYLTEELGKSWQVGWINGEVPMSKRGEIFEDFRHPKGAQVLIAHPEVMAHGLDLTAADTIVFWCPYDRPEIYEQAKERIGGPRQKHKMSIIQLAGSEVERKIYARLEAKEKLQGVLLELVKQQIT